MDLDNVSYSSPHVPLHGLNDPYSAHQPSFPHPEPLTLSQLQGPSASQSVSGRSRICYGTLLDIKLSEGQRQESTIRVPLDAPTVTCSDTLYLRCVIEVQSGKCVIRSESQRIGVVGNNLTEVFNNVQNLAGVNLECFLKVRREQNMLTQSMENMAVDISVYGDNQSADTVGTKLAEADLFLQDPYWLDEATQYRNPQLMDLPDIKITDAEKKAMLPWLGNMATTVKQDIDEPQHTVDNLPGIIDRFTAHVELLQADADGRVKTMLLGHQKQALSFMLTREAGAGNHQSLSLWDDVTGDDEKTLYQHRITGAKSPAAREALGGILADDMGLGKSLSVLSLIAGTLHESRKHAELVTRMTPEELNQKALPSKSTLILVPSTLLMLSWREELRRHVHTGTLAVHEYHGHSRKVNVFGLLMNDIIVTTYATLASEFRRKQSRLHRIHWFRVVLDEAHIIRNSSTRQYKAAAALHSRHRWCLTGTPIQNSLDDLSSLIRFLRLPLLEIPVQFRRHIVSRAERRGKDETPDYENLRTLLEAICLRRNKSVLDVPPSQETRRELDLNADEAEAYLTLKHRCKTAMDMAVAGHRSKEVHQTILHALLRLRIFCNNASFFGRPEAALLTSSEEIESLLQQRSDDGVTCYNCAQDLLHLSYEEEEAGGRVTGCQQFVCKHCVQEHRQSVKSLGKCPICKEQHDMFLKFSNGSQEGSGPFPSKLLDLVKQVQHFRSHGPGGKGIIFSFWKKSLDVVGKLLDQEGIHYHRVDGSLPTQVRSDVLQKFEHEHGNGMLLMTFSTGAVGLNNLSVATHVHILEPQWNPSVESQAIGRLVRLGQKHSVQVIRYLMKGTVEMHVQSRQVGKIALARDGFDTVTKTWMNRVLNSS